MDIRIALTLAAILFSIGIFGALTRRNVLGTLISIELMANAVNLNLVAFSRYTASTETQVLALFSMALTVAEVAIGLAIVILIFRTKGDVIATTINEMKR